VWPLQRQLVMGLAGLSSHGARSDRFWPRRTSGLLLAQAHEGAGLLGTFDLHSYLANGLPTMAAGCLAQRTPLRTAVHAQGAVITAWITISRWQTRQRA